MTSEPAGVTSHMREPDRDESQESAKIPLKYKGLDIATQMRSVKQAEPDLARAVGHYSASVEQTLSAIGAIEKTLQNKRRQIDEIQARQQALAREYRDLGRSLESATKDLAQQFAAIIRDLESDLPVAEPPAEEAAAAGAPEMGAPEMGAPATGATGAEPPADKALETSEPGHEPPADGPPETAKAPALDLDTADLPPVPEFLGDRQKPLNQKDDGDPEGTGSGARGWWKHGRKG